MSRRRRNNNNNMMQVVSRAAKRPIDKEIIVVNDSSAAGIQENTLLTTATFPCTITGIRWDFGVLAASAAANCLFWAIVVVKDGDGVNTFATSDASSLYQPEQNVIAFGSGIINSSSAPGGPLVKAWEGSTKSMRKLMAGDQLFFTYIGTGATASWCGAIQFFCKT